MGDERTFIYPSLGGVVDTGLVRVLGPGLGNSLFPWARAEILANLSGLPILFPTWPQIKLGPILRRENDVRMYAKLFRNPGTYVGGLRKLATLAAGRHLDEATWSVRGESRDSTPRPRLVWVRGLGDMFRPLSGWREYLWARLVAMTRSEHLGALHDDRLRGSAALHIRMGDFRHPDEGALRAGAVNMQVPVSWFVDRVEYLRSIGFYKVYVFSDASDAELADVLRYDVCRRASYGSSVGDLFAMSRVDMLVLSNSTFGYWASFLGDVPSLHFPGQCLESFAAVHAKSYETDYGESI